MYKEKEQREGFVFYESFYESIKDLPADECQQCLVAICDYALYGILSIPDNAPIVKAIFTMAKPQIDANYRRYMNGKKGGAPKGNTNATKDKNNQNQPKEKDKDKDKDNDKEKGKEKEKDKDKDKDKESVDSLPFSPANGSQYQRRQGKPVGVERMPSDLSLKPLGDLFKDNLN